VIGVYLENSFLSESGFSGLNQNHSVGFILQILIQTSKVLNRMARIDELVKNHKYYFWKK